MKKIVTKNSLSNLLYEMRTLFGIKSIVQQQSLDLDAYVLNINDNIFDAEGQAAILGTGQLGSMILGKES